MTEHERALRGELFDPHSDELVALKHKAHVLCQKFNLTFEGDEGRQEIMKDVLGDIGPDYLFLGDVRFNYGVNTHIGRNFIANYHLTVLDDAEVNIGDYVMLGPNVSIMCANHPLIPAEREHWVFADGHQAMAEYAKPITIGSHVWVGSNCTICGGVTIGDGAVIGAGSVVTKDIPAGYVAYGNPCRAMRPISERDSLLPQD